MKLFAFALLATGLAAVSAEVHGRSGHRLQRKRLSNNDSQLQRRETESGKFSWYDTEESGNAGSCGDHIKNSDFAVAMNVVDYRREDCNKKIRINYKGKTAVAVIKDLCPTCPGGGLDLSMGLFDFFEDRNIGIIHGGWTWDNGDTAPAPSNPPAPEPTTTTQEQAPPPSSTPAPPAPEPTTTQAPPPPAEPTTTEAPAPPPQTTSTQAPPPPPSTTAQPASSARRPKKTCIPKKAF